MARTSIRTAVANVADLAQVAGLPVETLTDATIQEFETVMEEENVKMSSRLVLQREFAELKAKSK